jgi:hypothetical protein
MVLTTQTDIAIASGNRAEFEKLRLIALLFQMLLGAAVSASVSRWGEFHAFVAAFVSGLIMSAGFAIHIENLQNLNIVTEEGRAFLTSESFGILVNHGSLLALSTGLAIGVLKESRLNPWRSKSPVDHPPIESYPPTPIGGG